MDGLLFLRKKNGSMRTGISIRNDCFEMLIWEYLKGASEMRTEFDSSRKPCQSHFLEIS